MPLNHLFQLFKVFELLSHFLIVSFIQGKLHVFDFALFASNSINHKLILVKYLPRGTIEDFKLVRMAILSQDKNQILIEKLCNLLFINLDNTLLLFVGKIGVEFELQFGKYFQFS